MWKCFCRRVPRRGAFSLAALVLAAGMPACLNAAAFRVDPARSAITIKGNLAGFTIQEQGPGSLSSRIEGTLTVALTADTIQFLEGPLVRIQDNGVWQPKTGGEPGSEPASFAARASALLATAVGAARDMELSLLSAALPLADNTFNAADLVFSFPAGGRAAFDYRVTGLLQDADRVPLEGIATNVALAPATLVTDDALQTLTIPLDTSYQFGLISDDDTTITIQGQLVATRSLAPLPTEFAAWIHHFFPDETDPAVIGPDANPDGDPWPNFVEFAFGLDPTQPDPRFAPLRLEPDPESPGQWHLVYERPRGLEGVRYLLFSSSTLGAWDPLAMSTTVTDLGNDRERVELHSIVPLIPVHPLEPAPPEPVPHFNFILLAVEPE